MKIQKWPSWLILVCLLVATHSVGATPKVVTTIKPLHSIVAAIMAGVGTPILLLSGQGSHHHFHLRPSASRTLHQADMVFWVGPELEAGLKAPLAQWLPKERVIALADTPGITRLGKRAVGIWPNGTIFKAYTETERTDPHIWFDPRNMRAFVDRVELMLASVDPANQARYQLNGKHLKDKLTALELALSTELIPHSGTPYIVIHDAFRYLEQRYNLRAVGALVADSDAPVGAKGLREMRGLITEQQIGCVFYDGLDEKRLAQTLTNGGPARAIALDLQGRNIDAGTEFYFQLMRGLAKDLRRCLMNTPQ